MKLSAVPVMRLRFIGLVVGLALTPAEGILSGWWNGSTVDVAATTLGIHLTGLAYLTIGTVLTARVPGHRIGAVSTIAGLSVLVGSLAGVISDAGHVVGSAIGGGLYLTWIFLAGFVLLWFPTGHPPSPEWRWIEWVGYFGVTLNLLAYTFAGELCQEFRDGRCVELVKNPIGVGWIPNPEYGSLAAVVWPVAVTFVVASAAALAGRFLRSRGAERKQLMWLIFAATVLIGSVVISYILPVATWVSSVLFGLANLGIPAAVAIAVLRYRLYEIDRIISRTIGYALVIGVLGLVYAAGAVWLPSSMMGGQAPPLFVAGSTLAAAGLFNPIRRRILARVDRRFYRSRYNFEQIAAGFAGDLRRLTNPAQLESDWVTVVSSAVRPATVSVWIQR